MKPNFIEKIVSHFVPNTKARVYTVYTTGNIEELLNQYTMVSLCEQIVVELSKKYVEDFGPEILKRIQEKTIESKVIQKVIENLKSEIKSGKQ